jgi:hypothetical protein
LALTGPPTELTVILTRAHAQAFRMSAAMAVKTIKA